MSVRWAVIGASRISDEHMIPAICNAGGAVVALCGSDRARAADLAARHRIPRVYGQPRELIEREEFDIAYVGGRNELHAEQVEQLAEAGRHVLCEKPISLSIADAERMVEACRRAGVVLATNHALRGLPAVRALRGAIDDGVAGRVIGLRLFNARHLEERDRGWRLEDPAAGGVVRDISVHTCDAVRYLLGGSIREVVAFGRSGQLGDLGLAEDVMGVLRLDGGVLASFHDAYTYPHARTGIEVHGEEASLHVGSMLPDPEVALVAVRGRVREALPVPAPESPYVAMVRSCNDAVLGTGEPLASGEDGLQALLAATAIARSIEERRAVAVHPSVAGRRERPREVR